VVHADHIAVLEKGSLIEEGTHLWLWQQKGKYYNMWQKQLPFFSENDCYIQNENNKAGYHEAV
jgi:ATP-binding cassette subfamily B protein